MDLSTANDKTHGPGTDKDIQVKNVQQTQAQSQQPQYRTLYIIVFGSALFKAHWSFWAPNIEDRTQKTGKKAQAVGSVADGFQIEFVRNYNLTSDTRQPTIIEIGQIQTDHLQDSPDSGNATDSSPTDHFERIALSIPAPRASLNKKNPLSCIDEGSQKTGRDIGVAGPSRDIVSHRCQDKFLVLLLVVPVHPLNLIL